MKHNFILFPLLLLAALVPSQAVAWDFWVDGLYYTYNDNGTSVTITGTSSELSELSEFIIPETVPYNGTTYSVTSIGNYAFDSWNGLTSVTIPNSVISIGCCAFQWCRDLNKVTIPNSVTTIGDLAFCGCSGLTSIVVASGNPNYDSRGDCNAIIETVTNTLIAGCKKTVIPNSVTSIGDGAFEDCSGLTSLTIPNSITSIGNYAFYGCSGLMNVIIPNSVTNVGMAAFKWCTKLADFTLSNSLVIIPDEMFSLCKNLKNLTIPNSVTSIGWYAFGDCSGLRQITFEGLTKMDVNHSALTSCMGLITINVPGEYLETYKKMLPKELHEKLVGF